MLINVLSIVFITLSSSIISSNAPLGEPTPTFFDFPSIYDIISKDVLYSSVKTPNNSTVTTIDYSQFELTDSQKADCNYYVSIHFPNASFLSSATVLYNCHSYAWYMQDSTYNVHWMSDPALYISDSSYYRIYSNIQVGDIICYINSDGDNIHSGRINQVIGGSSNNVCGNSNLYQVTSKWGLYGLYSHRGDECPYTSYYYGASGEDLATNVRFYRISTSHSHSLHYISHTKHTHLTYCSCSMACYESHDWISNNKGLGNDNPDYVPGYTCIKCGMTSNFPY